MKRQHPPRRNQELLTPTKASHLQFMLILVSNPISEKMGDRSLWIAKAHQLTVDHQVREANHQRRVQQVDTYQFMKEPQLCTKGSCQLIIKEPQLSNKKETKVTPSTKTASCNSLAKIWPRWRQLPSKTTQSTKASDPWASRKQASNRSSQTHTTLSLK